MEEIKELRGAEEKFPYDTALVDRSEMRVERIPRLISPSRLTAYDFSISQDASYRFGASIPDTAAQLRALADKIESRQVILQRVQVVTEAAASDYPMTALIVQFHEKDPK